MTHVAAVKAYTSVTRQRTETSWTGIVRKVGPMHDRPPPNPRVWSSPHQQRSPHRNPPKPHHQLGAKRHPRPSTTQGDPVRRKSQDSPTSLTSHHERIGASHERRNRHSVHMSIHEHVSRMCGHEDRAHSLSYRAGVCPPNRTSQRIGQKRVPIMHDIRGQEIALVAQEKRFVKSRLSKKGSCIVLPSLRRHRRTKPPACTELDDRQGTHRGGTVKAPLSGP
jgi:hypothetical protein